MKFALSNNTETSEFGGGRVAILLLLFVLAIYEFITAGFPLFAAICLIPLVILGLILTFMTFKRHMIVFWVLMVINYLIQWKSFPNTGLPTSIPNEALEIVLLAQAIIDTKEQHFERAANLMMFMLIIWASFCIIEVCNDTCGLGWQIGAWYAGARMMAFQLIYAVLVYTVYISTPQKYINYLYFWGGLSLFAAFWVWKQQKFGLTQMENAFLQGRGRSTHIINGGTTIRLFSVFSDAANFGVNMAATAISFLIFALTSKIKKHRIYFLIVGLACVWAMFPSGTRTATFCLGAGIAFYVVLSKSIKIAVPVGLFGMLLYFILAFTTIGNGNASIRRMRSGFDKDDASANQRTINQAVMKKYLADAPFGIGIGIGYENVPANNKFRKLATLPPDSEYVYIWQHTGVVGITLFLITTAIMLAGACRIVMFRLKNRALQGMGAGLCCGFVALQLGGYGNQVLMQFPNCLIFYGGLALVYTLPHVEPEWEAYEDELFAQQQERERLKMEKKNASRV